MKEIVKKFDPQCIQNDAHEFLTFLLDNVNEEYSKINLNEKKNSEIVKKIKDEDDDKDVDDGWEEVNSYYKKKVKKGGKRMKLANNLCDFKLTSIGKVFQGVLKIETETKGII